MAIELLSVVGPTASGKTRRAVEIAKAFNCEIISGDSRQVYRGMDLGTGKDLEEYGDVPYHMIDIVDAGVKYNLHQFITDAKSAVKDIQNRGKLPLLCGGSGLYVETLLCGIDLPDVPANQQLREELEGKSLNELSNILASFRPLHNTTDTDNKRRAIRAIEIETYLKNHPDAALRSNKQHASRPKSLIIGLDINREERRKRISARLQRRVEEGMIDEIRNLLESGISADDLIYYGLEYKFLTLYVIGKISFNQMLHELEIAIHQFAKRQMTWFRGMERRGFTIHWLPFDMPSEKLISSVKSLMESY